MILKAVYCFKWVSVVSKLYQLATFEAVSSATVIREMFAGRKFLRISRTALHPRKFPAAKMSKLRFPNVIGMGEEAESAKISCRKSGLAARAAKFSGRKHFPNYSNLFDWTSQLYYMFEELILTQLEKCA